MLEVSKLSEPYPIIFVKNISLSKNNKNKYKDSKPVVKMSDQNLQEPEQMPLGVVFAAVVVVDDFLLQIFDVVMLLLLSSRLLQ
jgi:hypothetical protein